MRCRSAKPPSAVFQLRRVLADEVAAGRTNLDGDVYALNKDAFDCELPVALRRFARWAVNGAAICVEGSEGRQNLSRTQDSYRLSLGHTRLRNDLPVKGTS